jgi:hypothetical protein
MINISEKHFHYAISVAIIGALFFCLIYAMLFASSLPDVHYSYATGECVKVINYGTDYTCDTLPEKYIHVWVE